MRYKELSKPQTKQNNSTYFIEMPHTGIIHPEQSWAWISEACKHPDGSDRVKPLHFNSGELLPQFMSLVLQKYLKFSLAAWSSANYWKKRMFSNADRWRQKCSELELAPRNRTTRICKKSRHRNAQTVQTRPPWTSLISSGSGASLWRDRAANCVEMHRLWQLSSHKDNVLKQQLN